MLLKCCTTSESDNEALRTRYICNNIVQGFKTTGLVVLREE